LFYMIYLNSIICFFFLASISIYIYNYQELFKRLVLSIWDIAALKISWFMFSRKLKTEYFYSFIFFQHYRVYTWISYYVQMVLYLIGSLFRYLYYTMPLIFHPGVKKTSYYNHYQKRKKYFYTWYSNLQD
jgi:hypothetical protein